MAVAVAVVFALVGLLAASLRQRVNSNIFCVSQASLSGTDRTVFEKITTTYRTTYSYMVLSIMTNFTVFGYNVIIMVIIIHEHNIDNDNNDNHTNNNDNNNDTDDVDYDYYIQITYLIHNTINIYNITIMIMIIIMIIILLLIIIKMIVMLSRRPGARGKVQYACIICINYDVYIYIYIYTNNIICK